MDESEESVQLLGAAMRDRRTELGITQAEAVSRAGKGVSLALWSKIENGHPGRYRPASMAAIDRALSWPIGTATAIVQAEGDAAVEVRLSRDDLTLLLEALSQAPSEVAHVIARRVAASAGVPAPTEFRKPEPLQQQVVALQRVVEEMSARLLALAERTTMLDVDDEQRRDESPSARSGDPRP